MHAAGAEPFLGADGMTEKDVQEAQAWCDGFTHGAMAAQQDGNQVASTLDAQSAQPPEGVPDVLYYQGAGMQGAGSLGQIGGPPDQGQPLPGGMTPGAIPSLPPTWSSAAAPADTSYPSSNPASEAVPATPLDVSSAHNSATHYHGSAAFPGVGSLRSMGPDASNMPPPAPASEAEPALRPTPIAAPYNLPPSAAAPPHAGSSRRPDLRPRPGRPRAAGERESYGRGRRTNRRCGRRSRHRAGDAPAWAGGSAMGTARHSRLTGSRPVVRD